MAGGFRSRFSGQRGTSLSAMIFARNPFRLSLNHDQSNALGFLSLFVTQGAAHSLTCSLVRAGRVAIVMALWGGIARSAVFDPGASGIDTDSDRCR